VFYITCKCASVELGGTGATALKCLELLIRMVFFFILLLGLPDPWITHRVHRYNLSVHQ